MGSGTGAGAATPPRRSLRMAVGSEDMPVPREGHVKDSAPPPPARIVQAEESATRRADVVGLARRSDVVRELFAAEPGFAGEEGVRRETTAVLTPVAHGPKRGGAVAVHIDGHHVGYLGKRDAKDWLPALLALADGGAVLSVPADLWGATRCSRVYGDVRLELPEDPGSVAGAAALY